MCGSIVVHNNHFIYFAVLKCKIQTSERFGVSKCLSCCECVHRVNISRVESWLCLVCCFDTDCSFYSFFSFFFLLVLWVFPCFFSFLQPLPVLLSSLSPLTFFLCPVLYLICMQPSSAAFWHLSAIIWSGNCYVCLGLCFCLLVCPPCAFCAQHPKAGPLPIFHCTALPFTLGEVIIWSPARFVHLLTCKEIQSLIL